MRYLELLEQTQVAGGCLSPHDNKMVPSDAINDSENISIEMHVTISGRAKDVLALLEFDDFYDVTPNYYAV